MSEDLILKEIESNKEEYIEFLSSLIKTESYNPPGNEKNVAIVIEDYLRKNGIECELFPFGENRANLLASLNKNFDRKNLLYNGHMDVVLPGDEKEWRYHPLSAHIKRNKIIIIKLKIKTNYKNQKFNFFKLLLISLLFFYLR